MSKRISLSAERAHRTGRAVDWTVRDALEYALASLDDPNSEIASSNRVVIVLGTVDDDGRVNSRMVVATKNRFERDGLLAGALTAD